MDCGSYRAVGRQRARRGRAQRCTARQKDSAHAISTIRMYTVWVTRPKARALEARQQIERRTKHAKWLVCAHLMRIYKEDAQTETIQQRLRERKGLICANTRNVTRIMPRGGVTYDETKRHKHRIKDDEMYKMKRWPRRDSVVQPWCTSCSKHGVSRNLCCISQVSTPRAADYYLFYLPTSPLYPTPTTTSATRQPPHVPYQPFGAAVSL